MIENIGEQVFSKLPGLDQLYPPCVNNYSEKHNHHIDCNLKPIYCCTSLLLINYVTLQTDVCKQSYVY